MKLHVVYDGQGRIVAAVRLDAEHKAKHLNFGRLRPVVKPGHHSADLDVPEEHASLSFADVCRKLTVETTKPPRLKMAAK